MDNMTYKQSQEIVKGWLATVHPSNREMLLENYLWLALAGSEQIVIDRMREAVGNEYPKLFEDVHAPESFVGHAENGG